MGNNHSSEASGRRRSRSQSLRELPIASPRTMMKMVRANTDESIRVPSAFPCNNGFDQSIGIVDANNEFSNSPVGKHKGKRGHQKAEEVKPPLVKQATLSAYIGSIDKKLEALAVKDSVAEEEPTKHLGDLCSGDVKGEIAVTGESDRCGTATTTKPTIVAASTPRKALAPSMIDAMSSPNIHTPNACNTPSRLGLASFSAVDLASTQTPPRNPTSHHVASPLIAPADMLAPHAQMFPRVIDSCPAAAATTVESPGMPVASAASQGMPSAYGDGVTNRMAASLHGLGMESVAWRNNEIGSPELSPCGRISIRGMAEYSPMALDASVWNSPLSPRKSTHIQTSGDIPPPPMESAMEILDLAPPTRLGGFVDMMPLESCVDDDGNESSTLDETLYGFGELLDESVDTIDRRTPMPPHPPVGFTFKALLQEIQTQTSILKARAVSSPAPCAGITQTKQTAPPHHQTLMREIQSVLANRNRPAPETPTVPNTPVVPNTKELTDPSNSPIDAASDWIEQQTIVPVQQAVPAAARTSTTLPLEYLQTTSFSNTASNAAVCLPATAIPNTQLGAAASVASVGQEMTAVPPARTTTATEHGTSPHSTLASVRSTLRSVPLPIFTGAADKPPRAVSTRTPLAVKSMSQGPQQRSTESSWGQTASKSFGDRQTVVQHAPVPAVSISSADASPERLDQRARDAIAWTNKEVTKLIQEIVKHGRRNENGQVEITFGTLFDRTENVFEALSGTCKTAKKHGIVAYDGEHLWQGVHKHVSITLLKETHSGINALPRRRSTLTSSSIRGSGFAQQSLSYTAAKCHKCEKTVYQMEYVGASGYAFHKACFRCVDCTCKLKMSDYCVSGDGDFRCTNHHRDYELAANLRASTNALLCT